MKFPTYKFKDSCFYFSRMYSYQGSYAKGIAIDHVLAAVRVAQCVAIEDSKGNAYPRVSMLAVHDPKRDPWFLIECVNTEQANFYLITDGDCWMPVVQGIAKKDRKHNEVRFRLSTTMKPARSVNLAELNQIDQFMIQAAIDQFINKTENPPIFVGQLSKHGE